MYDYGWRNYVPDIGRWTQIDPLFNDLKFANDNSQVDDEDDPQEVYMSIVNDLEIGGGIYNTDNLNPYGYGYNNPISFDDPDGRCPSCIVGAIVGAAVDYGTQVAANYLNPSVKNKWTHNINLSSIALSAVEGGLTSGGSVGKKLLVKTAVLAANNIVEVKTNDKGGIEGKVDKNPRNILKNIVIDATVNGVAKGTGNTGVKLLSKGGVHKGSISTAIKKTITSNGGTVTRELNNKIKTFSKNAIKQTGKTLENTTKAATLKPVNDAKDKTNQR